MRYIRLLESGGPKDANGTLNQAWLDKAQNLLAQLAAAPNHIARCVIIDANENLWKELRDWLYSLSHGKCWYSEARDVFSYVDVEHYRPKAQVKRKARGTKKEGYWWVAFDWQNYRMCGQVGNKKKGIFFPLAELSPVSTWGGLSINNELPLLLDPAKEGDSAFLSFNEEGAVEALADADPLSRLRVKETVEKLNLNYPRLKKARQRVWGRCRRVIDDCRGIAGNGIQAIGPAEMAVLQQKKAEIRLMIQEEAEFSAVAIACLQKSNIGWAIQLACGI